MTPTETQIARAREIVASQMEGEFPREQVMEGGYDSSDHFAIALAAIMETQEACAKVADNAAASSDEDTPGGWCAANISRSIAAAIRAGEQP